MCSCTGGDFVKQLCRLQIFRVCLRSLRLCSFPQYVPMGPQPYGAKLSTEAECRTGTQHSCFGFPVSPACASCACGVLPAVSIFEAKGGHTRLYADEQMQRELQMDDAGRLTGDLAQCIGSRLSLTRLNLYQTRKKRILCCISRRQRSGPGRSGSEIREDCPMVLAYASWSFLLNSRAAYASKDAGVLPSLDA